MSSTSFVRPRSATSPLVLVAGLALIGCKQDALVAPSVAAAKPASFSTSATPGAQWTRQFGSSAVDDGTGIAVAGNGVYAIGFTRGALPGQVNLGNSDGYLRRYDRSGTEVWTRQFGTSGNESAAGVAADASGEYVVGTTDGALGGQTSSGGNDAFVQKYDPDGNLLWTRQFGTFSFDQAVAVSIDAGAVYVFGTAFDALPGQNSGSGHLFVRKYDADGNEQWTRQFGTSGIDQAWAAFAGGGAVYVGGQTSGTFPGQTKTGAPGAFVFDAYVRKYDAQGNEVWTREFGAATTFDPVAAITANASGVYVGGPTSGALPGQGYAGNEDAFVRKFDLSGNEVWTREFGTENQDGVFAMTTDAGGVYAGGRTWGALAPTPGGLGDGFVRKFDFDGNEQWTQQFGSPGVDEVAGVAVDATGVYATGFANAAFPGQVSLGGPNDAWVIKLNLDAAPSDNTPPVIAPHVTGTPLNGWYTSDVFVSWSVTDAESPVTSPACAAQSVTTDTQGITFSCTGTSAGGSSTSTVTIKRDATKPVVTYTGNNGIYSVDQDVAITCASSDATSGIASDTCAPISGPAYAFNVGANSYSATATDNAGNIGEANASFTVQVTAQGICGLVDRFVTSAGTANSITVKLCNASKEGNESLKAFANEVRAQTGKALTAEQADVLLRLSDALTH